ncbi:MAG: glycosyltransferase [Clostridium sp.]|nr:glycosyltransferase [Clostridium sp.]
MDAAAFDELLQSDRCTDLMDRYPTYTSQGTLARQIFGSGSLQVSPHPVKTIGTFYYRLNNGGVEHVLSRLISLWTAAGYRVVLFTDKPPHPEDYPLPAETVHYLLPDTFRLTPETRKLRFRALQSVLRDEHVDVFVHHAFLSQNLLWDLLAVKTLGIPFIEYIHGSFSCQLPGGNPEEMDQLWTVTGILKNADKIICNSDAYKCFWRTVNPASEMSLNPCDLPKEVTVPKSESPLLLWVGRIAPEKQPEEAVKILSEVRKSMPSVRLKMVGGTDPEYMPYLDSLKACITSLGLEDSVSLEGYHSDPSGYYQEATLLLLTSAGEGFSLAIAEAKTYGLPCVSYDLPCTFFAEDAQGFFSVPMNDAAAAAREILGLLGDPAARAQAEKSAKKSAAAFSAAALSDQWVRIFSGFETSASSVNPSDPDSRYFSNVVSTLLADSHLGLEKLKAAQDTWNKDAAGGFLASVFDASFYATSYPDLAFCGGNPVALLRHFLEKGMREGRRACDGFDPKVYRDRYPDLKQAFGKDLTSYYLHYLLQGRAEGRKGI